MAIEEKSDFRSGDRTLIFAFLLGPLAAMSNLAVAYTLVPEACQQQSNMMLHTSTVVFLIVALAAAVIGRRYHAAATTEGIIRDERMRWMGLSAIVLSIISALVVIAMEVPNVVLRSCE